MNILTWYKQLQSVIVRWKLVTAHLCYSVNALKYPLADKDLPAHVFKRTHVLA